MTDLTDRIGTPNFNGVPCIIYAGRYANGRTAITARIAETGEPMATLTVNLHDILLDPDDLAINHDCEHDAVALLLAAGIAGRPHAEVTKRFCFEHVRFKIVRLTPAFFDLRQAPQDGAVYACPGCGLLMTGFHVQHSRINTPCPRCGRHLINEFTTPVTLQAGAAAAPDP